MKSQVSIDLYKSIRKQVEKELEDAKIAARNVLEDLSIEKAKVEMAKAKEEAILLSIGDGLIATDEKGNVTLINKTAEKLFDKKSEEVIGKSFFEVIVIEDEKGVPIPLEKRPIKMALAGGTTTTTTGPTYYYVRKDKTKFPAAIMVAPITLLGKIIGAIGVFRDITKEKEIDRAKSEFVSLASHQLRTPPTSMKWFLEMLLSGEVGQLNEKQKEYFNEVYKNNQRMIVLINALLNISRIELGVFAINPELTEMAAFMKDILEEFETQIKEKKLFVKESYTPSLPLMQIDQKLLRIAVQDVISNAVKYTAEKGTISIEIYLGQGGELIENRKLKMKSLVISIADTGYGIPSSQSDKIFTKLFRADNVKEKKPTERDWGYISPNRLLNMWEVISGLNRN